MNIEKTHIFSSDKAHKLDNKVRRFLQNPFNILSPYVSKGMTVLDYGCGNGYFSIPLSQMVSNSGKVYSVDIQTEMLNKLTAKLLALNISNVTTIHKSEEKLNLPVFIDVAIAVYVVHEIPDQHLFFKEIIDSLKPKGKLIVIEPNFIVSKQRFKKSIEIAKQAGFIESERLNVLFSKSLLLIKE